MKLLNNKGFTLIELLVVISIIGILATLVTTNLTAVQARGRDAKRKADLKQIQQALELHYNDFNYYPNSVTFDGTGTITGGTNTYMAQVPKDPRNTTTGDMTYIYCASPSSSPRTYTLYANLENNNDPDRYCNIPSPSNGWSNTSVRCDVVSCSNINTRDFAVSNPN